MKKNAVTTAKIKNNAVAGAKVKDGGLTGGDLADGTITGAKVADGSLTGADVNQSTLTSVRASNVTAIALTADCAPAAGAFPSGVSAVKNGKGCKINFPSSMLDCAITAAVAWRTDGVLLLTQRSVETLRRPSEPTIVFTETYTNETLVALPVDMTLVC